MEHIDFHRGKDKTARVEFDCDFDVKNLSVHYSHFFDCYLPNMPAPNKYCL